MITFFVTLGSYFIVYTQECHLLFLPSILYLLMKGETWCYAGFLSNSLLEYGKEI